MKEKTRKAIMDFLYREEQEAHNENKPKEMPTTIKGKMRMEFLTRDEGN